jgi:hypothetical protein
MDREKILYWNQKYDDEEDLYNKGDEQELGEKFRQNKFVSKDDLIRIVKWKFQDKVEYRQPKILKLLENVESPYIEDVSRLAFKYQDDKIRIKLLKTIDGVGNALTSVILSFYDHDDYGVLDTHAWKGLFGEKPKDLFTNTKHVLMFFNRIRDISKETGLPCRTIEKAYFKMDLDRSKS